LHENSAFSNFSNYSSNPTDPVFQAHLSLNVVPYGDLSVSGLLDFQESQWTVDNTQGYDLEADLGEVPYQSRNNEYINSRNALFGEEAQGQLPQFHIVLNI
jgi:hypothetical protein